MALINQIFIIISLSFIIHQFFRKRSSPIDNLFVKKIIHRKNLIMKNPRIMIVCGFGLGTSLVLKMTLDDVLEKKQIDAETFCSDADTAIGQNFDLVLTSKEMKEIFKEEKKPVIFIKNFLSFDEVEEKSIPLIQKLIND